MNPKDRKLLEMARDALEVCYTKSVPRDVLRRKTLAAIEERLQADEKEEPVVTDAMLDAFYEAWHRQR